jgi:hypothetical protein
LLSCYICPNWYLISATVTLIAQGSAIACL